MYVRGNACSKTNFYRKGLIQGYSTYGGSGLWAPVSINLSKNISAYLF